MPKKLLKRFTFFILKAPNSKITLQRGVVRTNCIDSLDRTNFAQEIFGYYNCLSMLIALKVIKKNDIQMKSSFFNVVFEMYNKMGDSISMQYGGSIAHHAQMGKKKGVGGGISEMWTSIVRHYHNVYVDPSR